MFRERVADWVWNGDYDEMIKERIMEGEFDREVLARAQKLSRKSMKRDCPE